MSSRETGRARDIPEHPDTSAAVSRGVSGEPAADWNAREELRATADLQAQLAVDCLMSMDRADRPVDRDAHLAEALDHARRSASAWGRLVTAAKNQRGGAG